MDNEYAMESAGSQDVMQTLAAKAPPWLGSAVVHCVVILIMMQIQWEMGRSERRPVVVPLRL